MNGRLRHLLPLALAALLALPQGWCCIVAAKALAAKAAATAGDDCCCRSKCPPARPAPADPAPPPAPATFCCCDPVAATVKAGEVGDPAEDGLLFQLLPPPTNSAVPAGASPGFPPPPTRPLHLLRCVWLC